MTHASTKNWIASKALKFAGVIIAVWVVSVYANSLSVPFNYDDNVVIKQNESIQTPATYLAPDALHYRHVFYASFSLNYLWGEFDPTGYHVFNILLHLLSSLLVLSIVRMTLARGTHLTEETARTLACATALLFALHPVHTEAVTYVSGRSSSLSGLLFLVALWLFIRGNFKSVTPTRNAIFHIASLLVWGLSLLSKEVTIGFPLIALLYDRCFMRNDSWLPFRYRLYSFYIPLPALGIGLVLASPETLMTVRDWLGRWNPGYALQQLHVIPYAAKLVWFPINLTFDYEFPGYTLSTDSMRMASGIAAVSVLAAGLIYLYKVFPIAAFGISWFLILMAPTNSFLPRMDLLSERNLYLPSIGLILLSVFLIHHWTQRLLAERKFYRGLLVSALIALTLFQSALVIKRNLIYQSNLTLWEDAYRKSPGKARIYHNLSYFYTEAKDYDRAFVMLRKLATSPATPYYLSYAHTNLGNIYVMRRQMDLAEASFAKALEIFPDLPTGYFNIAVLAASRGQHARARGLFERAIKTQKAYTAAYLLPPVLYLYKGTVNYHLKIFNEAEQDLRRFLKEVPNSPDGHLFLGHVYRDTGREDKALEAYGAVSSGTRIEGQAHFERGRLFERRQEFDRALAEYEASLVQAPDIPETFFRIGRILWEVQNDPTHARNYLEQALSLSPEAPLRLKTKSLLRKTR